MTTGGSEVAEDRRANAEVCGVEGVRPGFVMGRAGWLAARTFGASAGLGVTGLAVTSTAGARAPGPAALRARKRRCRQGHQNRARMLRDAAWLEQRHRRQGALTSRAGPGTEAGRRGAEAARRGAERARAPGGSSAALRGERSAHRTARHEFTVQTALETEMRLCLNERNRESNGTLGNRDKFV